MSIDDLSSQVLRQAELLDASRSIERLETNLNGYKEVNLFDRFGRHLRVFTKSQNLPKIEFSLARGKEDLGPNVIVIDGDGAKFCHIVFKSYNSIVYFGGDLGRARLKGRIIVNDSASVFIGKGCSSNQLELNISHPGCVIGDDCMFGRSVNVRTHTGHALYDIKTGEVGTSSRQLHIEPHVWIGEGARIFKGGVIGACSIVGYESLMMNDLPRFSVASGVPARVSSKLNTKLWMRSYSSKHKEQALYYYKKYCDAGCIEY